jgi:hypothetical protein
MMSLLPLFLNVRPSAIPVPRIAPAGVGAFGSAGRVRLPPSRAPSESGSSCRARIFNLKMPPSGLGLGRDSGPPLAKPRGHAQAPTHPGAVAAVSRWFRGSRKLEIRALRQAARGYRWKAARSGPSLTASEQRRPLKGRAKSEVARTWPQTTGSRICHVSLQLVRQCRGAAVTPCRQRRQPSMEASPRVLQAGESDGAAAGVHGGGSEAAGVGSTEGSAGPMAMAADTTAAATSTVLAAGNTAASAAAADGAGHGSASPGSAARASGTVGCGSASAFKSSISPASAQDVSAGVLAGEPSASAAKAPAPTHARLI